MVKQAKVAEQHLSSSSSRISESLLLDNFMSKSKERKAGAGDNNQLISSSIEDLKPKIVVALKRQVAHDNNGGALTQKTLSPVNSSSAMMLKEVPLK